MSRSRTYSDGDLALALQASKSWRGVLRTLGMAATSSGAMRSVRARADLLGLEYSHFSGQRRWSDEQLRAAVLSADSWPEVLVALGLNRSTDLTRVRGHVTRLGIDAEHLAPERLVLESRPEPDTALTPRPANLGRAGTMLAAAWFSLCGGEVSWPLEPCRYDLIVAFGSTIRRVQVKTTTTRIGASWKVYLSTSGPSRRTYDPGEIDDFFIVDGDSACYLIPVRVVGGLQAIQLASYQRYRVWSFQGNP